MKGRLVEKAASPLRFWPLGLFMIVLTAGVVLRFSDLRIYPPGLYPDEAYYGTEALRGLATGDFRVYYPEAHSGEGLLTWIHAPIIAFLGTQPWVLRVQPAIIGSLSILAIWGCAREFARNFVRPDLVSWLPAESIIALLSAFFLATSSWHVHISRISFRTIYVPFFTILIIWTLLRARRCASVFLPCAGWSAALRYILILAHGCSRVL